MKNKIGENDLVARLDNSFCRYKGEAVYVRVNGRQLLLYKPSKMHGEALAKISPYDPEFDIESLPLGYVQFKHRTYYLTRVPRRRYVQGVNADSLSMTSIPDSVFAREGNTIGREGILSTTGFEDMVMNKYRSIFDVFSDFAKDTEPREEALSRDVAVYKNALGIVNVYFKNDLVGWIAPNSNVVHVPSNEYGWVVSMYLRDLNWQVD